MDKVQIWPTIKAERAALVEDLAAVDDGKWDTSSLCDDWSVRDVLAHMTAAGKMSPPTFFGKLISSGFSFTKLQAKDIATERGTSPADTLSRFKAIVGSTTHPPGPAFTWLGETIVHGEAIRRPLGIAHAYPNEAVAAEADSYHGSDLVIPAQRRIPRRHRNPADTGSRPGHGA